MKTPKSTDAEAGPPNKRIKSVGNTAAETESEQDAYAIILNQAWNHYRNFIDGPPTAEDEDEDEEGMPETEQQPEGNDEDKDEDDEREEEEEGGGDVDELLELIEIVDSLNVTVPPLAIDCSENNAKHKLSSLRDHESLLALLLSMAYLNLATHAISETMFDPNKTNNANEEEEEAEEGEKEQQDDTTSPEYHFGKSLHYWPTNPAAHSLFANYHRMNSISSIEDICDMYVKASEYARGWRVLALTFLQSEIDEENNEQEEEEEEEDGEINAKEWVELLVLNGALDVDYIGGGDSDDEEEEDETETNAIATGVVNQEEEYSASEVEATASFMAAFLLSILSKHEDALPHLKKFQLSHRIHPNVWKEAAQSSSHSTTAIRTGKQCKDEKSTDGSSKMPFSPRMYHGATTASPDNGSNQKSNIDGLLPPDLYQRLCTLLAPNAPYWNESDYNNRGYYSYFIDLDSKTDASTPSVRDRPTNVIEDVIVNHLLPLTEQTLKENNSGSDETSRIVGAEWWAHTRPLGANLGHQIHFDTDESLLNREKRVTHPIISSVLYLTGDDTGTGDCKAGSTVVFDQTPESKEVAPRAWISHPKNNAFMNFPGDLLHGVLPCAGSTGSENNNGNTKKGDDPTHRLTFMVGFWTRDVTEGMGERKLYSPCGPLPPANSDHSWVIDSQRGYNDDDDATNTRQKSAREQQHQQRDMVFENLPSASPAWEQFDSKKANNNNNNQSSSKPGTTLTIPKGLDHRFFVWDAPSCFSDSLFEKEDCF